MLNEGPVDYFDPTCQECGTQDSNSGSWVTVMPPNEPVGVYCGPCALNLSILPSSPLNR